MGSITSAPAQLKQALTGVWRVESAERRLITGVASTAVGLSCVRTRTRVQAYLEDARLHLEQHPAMLH